METWNAERKFLGCILKSNTVQNSPFHVNNFPFSNVDVIIAIPTFHVSMYNVTNARSAMMTSCPGDWIRQLWHGMTASMCFFCPQNSSLPLLTFSFTIPTVLTLLVTTFACCFAASTFLHVNIALHNSAFVNAIMMLNFWRCALDALMCPLRDSDYN